MNIAIGADHAGYELKELLIPLLASTEHEPVDMGTDSPSAVDYPDIAERVVRELLEGRCQRGVLICGSGVGVSVAANKFAGIRAAICHDAYSAHQGVEHDDMNVLVLGARIIGVELAKELVLKFLAAEFTNEERHARRLGKVVALEARWTR